MREHAFTASDTARDWFTAAASRKQSRTAVVACAQCRSSVCLLLVVSNYFLFTSVTTQPSSSCARLLMASLQEMEAASNQTVTLVRRSNPELNHNCHDVNCELVTCTLKATKSKVVNENNEVTLASTIERIKTWKLISFKELPEYLRDNDYLLHHHRPQLNSFVHCVKSIFKVHTGL